MNYTDNIDFYYFLETDGWSTCFIYVAGKMYEMGPTHIFENPIKVLLNGFTELLRGAKEIKFKWHDEPGEYNWHIKRNKEQKHKILISITECVEIKCDSKPKLETIKFEVKLKLFSICILHQMEKIHDLMAEKSYKENREGQFPFNAFNEFKQAYEQAYS